MIVSDGTLGLVIGYTGNGKGKTTAALGLALRQIGWGRKVLYLQFMKGPLKGVWRKIAAGRFLRDLGMEQR